MGEEAAREAEIARYREHLQVPVDQVKIEIRRNGRWIEVDEASLSA